MYKVTRLSSESLKYHFDFTYFEFIKLLESQDKNFLNQLRSAFNDATNQLNSSYLWECVPVSNNSVSKKFEFVVTKSVALSGIRQNYSSFQEHFDRCNDRNVCSFKNLGKDATLIVPIPRNGKSYKSISDFAKNSSNDQWGFFWVSVGNSLSEDLRDSATRWLSTNGLGVHYLHVRVDSSPKYYSWSDYRIENSESFVNSDAVENIRRNIKEWDFKQIVISLGCSYDEIQGWVGRVDRKEIMLVHNSVEIPKLQYSKQGGNLIIDKKKMFREEDFDKREWAEIEQVWNDFYERNENVRNENVRNENVRNENVRNENVRNENVRNENSSEELYDEEYNLALKKLRGEASWDYGETKEGLQGWIALLELRRGSGVWRVRKVKSSKWSWVKEIVLIHESVSLGEYEGDGSLVGSKFGSNMKVHFLNSPYYNLEQKKEIKERYLIFENKYKGWTTQDFVEKIELLEAEIRRNKKKQDNDTWKGKKRARDDIRESENSLREVQDSFFCHKLNQREENFPSIGNGKFSIVSLMWIIVPIFLLLCGMITVKRLKGKKLIKLNRVRTES